ncbi:MAG: SMP-30/gluconolactonase/LRE family protein [Planctomycetota bacterium]|nr:SMP-30/gluconolactonase/LRE family protein [Planctomycetota bacterium]
MKFSRALPIVLLLLAFQPLAAQDMPLSQVLIDDKPWQLVGEGYQFTEGPAVTRDGAVYFTDVPANTIYRVGDDGKPVVFINNSDRTSGLMFGPLGLYGCSSTSRSILLFNPAGEKKIFCQNVTSNDLVVTSQGAVYFTNPANNSIHHVSPDGESRVVDEGIEFPNGLILWPDQQTLVVADMKGAHLWNFRIEKDGSLSHKQPYSTMQLPVGKSASGADGMTVDRDGRIYVATELGIQVFDTQGRLSGIIGRPQAKFLSNIVLGGPDFNLLYATSSDRVYRRQVKVSGFPFWKKD